MLSEIHTSQLPTNGSASLRDRPTDDTNDYAHQRVSIDMEINTVLGLQAAGVRMQPSLCNYRQNELDRRSVS